MKQVGWNLFAGKKRTYLKAKYRDFVRVLCFIKTAFEHLQSLPTVHRRVELTLCWRLPSLLILLFIPARFKFRLCSSQNRFIFLLEVTESLKHSNSMHLGMTQTQCTEVQTHSPPGVLGGLMVFWTTQCVYQSRVSNPIKLALCLQTNPAPLTAYGWRSP